jgi:hypothetical protein
MPYALIPDGYSLKKVTKAQKSALDELNRAKAIERFAIVGIKGTLSDEGARNLLILTEQGALALDPDASVLAQTLFPTPEKRAEKKEISELLTGLGL